MRWFRKRQDRKVDFIICGTQKGGTTALDAYLRTHPELCMANKKEVHYFDNEKTFRDNRPDDAAYHAAFTPGPGHHLLGEATPSYMFWHDAPRRMWQYNRDLKLIVCLRNPVERAYSHWNMEHARGFDTLSFGEAIRQETERCRAALPYQHLVYSYVDRGFYSQQLRRLWSFFPKNQVLVLRNENLRNEPRETLRAVCSFLGVAPLQQIVEKDVHSRPYAAPINEEDRAYLMYLYEYEIRTLERMLGWDCSRWLSG